MTIPTKHGDIGIEVDCVTFAPAGGGERQVFKPERLAAALVCVTADKPLGRKAYGSIPHLPNSRRGPGDHGCPDGVERILTRKVRDKHDRVIVTEKLDGANVAVARVDDAIIPLGRKGNPTEVSPWRHIRAFGRWVAQPDNYIRFNTLLREGEWVSGEWLALAHGTRYDLIERDPFVAFDLFREGARTPHDDLVTWCAIAEIETVPVIHTGGPISIPDALNLLGKHGHYGALDLPEGCVWRLERDGEFELLAKYVRPEKVDGCYLPENSASPEIWNWPPPSTSAPARRREA